MKPIAHPPRRQAGFTLIELIIVLVLTTLIGATVAIFVRPAIGAYTDTRVRAELSDQADTALRRIVRDIRQAVPNSIRAPLPNCFELVPAVAGGRYRMGPDAANSAAYVDPSQQTTSFDVLTAMNRTPNVGDFVVINNQNGNDVYAGTNRAAITAVSTPAATHGTLRIAIGSGLQISPGYAGGRFQVVASGQRSVFYVCSGADGTLDSQGNGKGTLYRVTRDFNATYPSACPATAGGTVLATRVHTCNFIYTPNQGATQQSGFLWMLLAIGRNGETATQSQGAHVTNTP
jgi:MSHA biogenesis protein MshO